jgi:hypothetical protein
MKINHCPDVISSFDCSVFEIANYRSRIKNSIKVIEQGNVNLDVLMIYIRTGHYPNKSL